MRWLDTPPCVPLEIAEARGERLILRGPTTGARAVSGANAAMGGLFAGVGARFLRLPLPGPVKLVPLAFTVVGGAMAALGAGKALARVSIEVSREGLTWRWKLPALDERSLHVAAADIAALEITKHAHRETTTADRDYQVFEFRLVVITRDGRATPIDTHGTHAQAELRRQAVAARLPR